MYRARKGLTRQKGFSIMEILVAIVIFAIGMMALAQLQGNLTRSSANANVRTVATNIAEETIEGLRGFAYLDTDPAGVLSAYEDIVSKSGVTETRGGIQYTVNTTVSDWYYDITSDTFMGWADYVTAYQARVGGNATPPDTFSDFKLVSVNVSWDDTRPWLIDESQTFSMANNNSIALSAVISSSATGGSARLVTNADPVFFTPYVDYSPGTNPEIIRLSLGANKFKESLTPAPKVFRADELVETRFDVITYSQPAGEGALFVRREEFIAVNCECVLKAPPGDPEDAGRRPTIWSGDEYNEALFVNKPYGTRNLGLNQQSQFCDVCCQDHHDGGTHADDLEAGARRYDPFPNSSRQYWDSGTFQGDHKHYYPDANGVLQVADTADDVYLESCALVRKDGFMRVTQDFNQEGVNVFPQDFMDDTSEVAVYSGYVTSAVTTYAGSITNGYESSPPSLPLPATGVEATDLWTDYTYLPLTIGGDGGGGLGGGDPGVVLTQQQLRDRGIYIAYVRNDLQAVLSCLAGGGTVGSCESNDVKMDQVGSANPLEILPFFDLQLTYLSRWNEVPINNPVDTTNQALLSGNAHSRGVAKPGTLGRQGLSVVSAKGNPNNVGLTDTDPVEPNFVVTSAGITVEVTTGDPPFDPAYPIVTGTITSSLGNNLKATDIVVLGTDASCDRTPDGFQCSVTGAAPTIRLEGYGKSTQSGQIDRVACSSTLVKLNESFSDINPWSIFSLFGASEATLHNINIEKAFTCGGA